MCYRDGFRCNLATTILTAASLLVLCGCGEHLAGPGTQQEAVAALRELGVHIIPDDNGKVLSLSLLGSRITDTSLEHLRSLPDLAYLDLRSTDVSDAGLKVLNSLPNLEKLYLSETKITDAGLLHLRGLRKLNVLDLHGTEITDSGLEYVSGLDGLEWLIIRDTSVTEAGVSKLKKALPDCRIEQ